LVELVAHLALGQIAVAAVEVQKVYSFLVVEAA
jgi:hypothetical protein